MMINNSSISITVTILIIGALIMMIGHILQTFDKPVVVRNYSWWIEMVGLVLFAWTSVFWIIHLVNLTKK